MFHAGRGCLYLITRTLKINETKRKHRNLHVQLKLFHHVYCSLSHSLYSTISIKFHFYSMKKQFILIILLTKSKEKKSPAEKIEKEKENEINMKMMYIFKEEDTI